ncbi:unnamed protein product [Euphydryas editha]|uniref:PiggyBac transposable element-derived protein domain-containing protein n=1 Tax=Euphydryas editha TaxID=104508 RepID=A0AAU9V123_EUPED|nr:unnamed protein product [Euphydryas editha]
MELMKPVYGLKRNLTCDNLFTAVPTAKSLLEKGIILLTLLSYCSQESVKKKVLMLSTMHDSLDEDNESFLPEIIAFYNKTKCGVDVFDQLSKKYSTSRKTRRWPLCIFYSLLNTVGL